METTLKIDSLKIAMVDPKLLIPHPDRERAKTVLAKDDFKYHAFKSSIEEFGIKSPLLVQESTNVIIGGRTRHEIALELELDRVPVHYVDVNDAQALYMLIQDILDEGVEETDIMKTSWQICQYVSLYGIRHGGDRKSAIVKEETLGYKDVAKIFGMSITSLKQHLRLQKLIEELQKLASEKVISLKGGYILAGLTAKEQYEAFQTILRNMKVNSGYVVAEKEAKSLKEACRIKANEEVEQVNGTDNWLDTNETFEISMDDEEAEGSNDSMNGVSDTKSVISNEVDVSGIELSQAANIQILEAVNQVDADTYELDKADREIEAARKTREIVKKKAAKLLNVQNEESQSLYAIRNVKESIHDYKLVSLRGKTEFITDMSLVKEKDYVEVVEWLKDLNDILQQNAADVSRIFEIVNKVMGK